MKALVALAGCVMLLVPSFVTEAKQSVSTPRLSGAQCLDSDRIRGWSSIDDDRILVDAGHRKYLIQVGPGCHSLGFSHTIGFKGDPMFGRVCGFGDEIVTKDYSCNIRSLELLTNEQYKQAQADYRAAKKARKAAGKSKGA